MQEDQEDAERTPDDAPSSWQTKAIKVAEIGVGIMLGYLLHPRITVTVSQ
jgi:hypothetical protein